ncbi:rho guanine nucleotide exchange factor 3 isoform X1 [Bubalus kerabau]|uniref:rho guanine nucleotide exchange factor 3 isoform X1 n=2 Tax=Bubalus TaxID=9918 RepID=UPI00244ECA61|nr:rho guanine nucleotide exchange factor 3 isoform X1 [Bubalus carabanensis]
MLGITAFYFIHSAVDEHLDLLLVWGWRKETWICDAASMDNSRVMNQCAFRGMEENTESMPSFRRSQAGRGRTSPVLLKAAPRRFRNSIRRPKRQRQNNFPMFPSPKDWNFRGRKRKQSTQDEDAVSLCSLDISEPSNKRVKPLSRVTSLANLIPPVKTTPLKRFSQTLQRSISFRSESRPDLLGPRPWSRNAAPSSTKRRDSKLWSETFDVCVNQMLTSKEIKRQEAIFELSQGEEDLIEDLKLAKKAYHDPMLKLSIMTEQELNQIFGTLDSLIPLHEDLLSQLRDVRKPDGSTEHVGPILVGWLPCLSSYDSYCSNQVAAKALLDHKKQDHRVQDFLQRCLESPFSRKLDLWNFLDIPRSRLVKYPLLLREILRHTPNDNPDQQHLEEAINIIQGIVAEINTKTGESECRYYKERLLYLEEGQKDSLIDNSKVLCCHGELKNNRGVKLHVFLFQEVLVITRAVTHNEQLCYQLYRQPIPMKDLLLEDLQDGEVRLGGSLRGAFSNNERIKNFFRVSFKNGSQSQTHSLQANDTFNKQQWLNCIRQAKETVLCATGQAAVLDSEGPFLDPATGSREPQGETKLEQMDQSDSESDCSMDTSEVSLDCERMEQTDSSCGNSRHVESNV